MTLGSAALDPAAADGVRGDAHVDVEVTAGPFERGFGLATVQMHTAAAASDARIPGLPAAEAARLRDQLTSLGETHAMGL